jgi:membrane protease YdiL (CAAX protease family)
MLNFFSNQIFSYFSLIFLIANLISFYCAKTKKLPTIFFLFSLATALIGGVINLLSCSIIFLFGFLVYSFYQKKSPSLHKVFIYFGIIIITIFSFLHQIPSIDNIELLTNIKLSKNSSNFDLWLNFDKPLIAIFLLFFSYNPPKKFSDYKNIFIQTIKLFVPLLIMLLALGTFVNFLVFDPKFPNFEITFLWLIKMVFLTIFAEEFFFRFFIQNNVILLCKNSKYFSKNSQIIGLIFTSIIFGLTHFNQGFVFILLATICGFFYGLIFIRTRYIEASILLHFLINLTHFIFFSYPSALEIS